MAVGKRDGAVRPSARASAPEIRTAQTPRLSKPFHIKFSLRRNNHSQTSNAMMASASTFLKLASGTVTVRLLRHDLLAQECVDRGEVRFGRVDAVGLGRNRSQVGVLQLGARALVDQRLHRQGALVALGEIRAGIGREPEGVVAALRQRNPGRVDVGLSDRRRERDVLVAAGAAQRNRRADAARLAVRTQLHLHRGLLAGAIMLLVPGDAEERAALEFLGQSAHGLPPEAAYSGRVGSPAAAHFHSVFVAMPSTWPLP